MIRTQVGFTEQEISALKARSETRASVKALAQKAAPGMWKDRTDLPEFEALRGEWDRRVL